MQFHRAKEVSKRFKEVRNNHLKFELNNKQAQEQT
jgi:hypothetical protein